MLRSYTPHQLERVIRAIRRFFEQQGFHEIIPPVMTPTIPLEPNLYPFTTDWHVSTPAQRFFLATSPERSLKLALAQGIEPCFAIGHSFRNLEGSGPLHSPEFLMLEWYRKDATYQDIMRDAQALIGYVRAIHDLPAQAGSPLQLNMGTPSPWPSLSLIDLFEKYASLSLPDLLSDQTMRTVAKRKGYATKQATWSQLFDQLFLNEVEPHLPKTSFFLVDFPARISPLCTPQPERPGFAQRFELFMEGVEIGNGNTEYTDTQAIRATFLAEANQRQHQQHPVPPVDEAFLSALETMSKASYAGMGIGVERLTTLCST